MKIRLSIFFSPQISYGIFFFLTYIYIFIYFYFTGKDYVEVPHMQYYNYASEMVTVLSYNMLCLAFFLIGTIPIQLENKGHFYIEKKKYTSSVLFYACLFFFFTSFITKIMILIKTGGNQSIDLGVFSSLNQLFIFYTTTLCIFLFSNSNKIYMNIVHVTAILMIIILFFNSTRSPVLELAIVYLMYFFINARATVIKIISSAFLLATLIFILNIISELRLGLSLAYIYSQYDGLYDFLTSFLYFEYTIIMNNIESEAMSRYDENNLLYGSSLFISLFAAIPFYSKLGLYDLVMESMNPVFDVAYYWLPNLRGSVGLGSALPGEFYMNFYYPGAALFFIIGWYLKKTYFVYKKTANHSNKIYIFGAVYPLVLIKMTLLLRNGFATSFKGILYIYVTIFLILLISKVKLKHS